MYNVSNAYKEQIKKPVRNESGVRVVYGAINQDAEKVAEVVSDVSSFNSEMPSIKNNFDIDFRYGYLELGNWLLDGTRKTIESETSGPQLSQGFVETIPYDENINQGPTFTITFGADSFSFLGLMICFDTINKVYPESITIVGKLNSVSVVEDTVTVTDSAFIYSNTIPEVDTIIITINSGRVPFTRTRVQQIILGVNYIFDNSNIDSLEWKRTNDLFGSKLPENTLKFSFIDKYNQYNPDNPEGLWSYIDAGQKVTLTFSYNLDDGTVEEIPGGVFYLTGAPSITQTIAMTKVQFEAVSKLQTLDIEYPYGKFQSGYYLSDAVDSLMSFSGISKEEYDITDLKNHQLPLYMNPLYKLPVKELLQLIAMCGRCVLTDNRDGDIVMCDRNTKSTNFTFDLNSILDKSPDIEKYPLLKNLILKSELNGWGDENLTTTVAEIQVNSDSSQLYVAEYDRSYIPVYSESDIGYYVIVPGNVTVQNYNFIGVYRTELLASGSGTISIKASPMTSIYKQTVSKNYNLEGEDCTIKNDLFGAYLRTNTSHGEVYNLWIGEILNKRNLYKFSSRGFPELDIGDIVTLETRYSDNLQGYLVSSIIKFNGTLSAEEEVLV